MADIYVVKYDEDGQHQWSFSLGGSGLGHARAVAHRRWSMKPSELPTAFRALATFISCLEIFDMSLFIDEQRTKGISIREVLGK